MKWRDITKKLELSKEKYSFYFGNYTYADDAAKSKIAKKIPRQHVGWGKLAVDIRANKTIFDRFENDTIGLNELFEKYKVIEAFNKIKDDVLICGCGFLALNGDRVFPFTAETATGVFDWFDQNLKNGVAIFQESTEKPRYRDEYRPDAYIEYYRDRTIKHQGENTLIEFNPTGRPLMGLLTHNGTTKKPFGQSVLSLPARNSMEDASRAIRQAMISAYYYNNKVDVIMGADSATAVDKVEGQVGDILKIGTNDNGQIPQIGEFAQHAMSPFTDTILISARNFCADTKLSLANISIGTDAPQSNEALEIINDNLKDDILRWERELGEQLKYFAITLYMYDKGISKIDENLQDQIRNIEPVFKSVFQQDVGKFGDGITKIAQYAPAITKSRTLWRNLGLPSAEIDAVIESVESAQ